MSAETLAVNIARVTKLKRIILLPFRLALPVFAEATHIGLGALDELGRFVGVMGHRHNQSSKIVSSKDSQVFVLVNSPGLENGNGTTLIRSAAQPCGPGKSLTDRPILVQRPRDHNLVKEPPGLP
jgi:hypothetical protein